MFKSVFSSFHYTISRTCIFIIGFQHTLIVTIHGGSVLTKVAPTSQKLYVRIGEASSPLVLVILGYGYTFRDTHRAIVTVTIPFYCPESWKANASLHEKNIYTNLNLSLILKKLNFYLFFLNTLLLSIGLSSTRLHQATFTNPYTKYITGYQNYRQITIISSSDVKSKTTYK